MALDNRDYNRGDAGSGYSARGRAFGGFGEGNSFVKWLLIVNVVVFLLDSILNGAQRSGGFSPSKFGNFNMAEGIYGFQVWRILTYQFLHADFFHLAFNMIGLYFFGPMLESWWGSKRFLAFYLLCGACGAALFSVFSLVPDLLNVADTTTLIGASGSVFGILAGAAVIAPNQVVQLIIPPIPMKLRTMALFFLGMAALSVIVGAQNAGGDAAHLGGALLGFLLIKNPGWLNFADRISDSPLADLKEKSQQAAATRSAKTEAKMQAEVDRILKKVSDNGLHSLTEKERQTLKRETDRQQNAR